MDVVKTLLIGLGAGAIATIIFTIVEYLDIAVTKRPVSTVPGEVRVALTGGNRTATGRAWSGSTSRSTSCTGPRSARYSRRYPCWACPAS